MERPAAAGDLIERQIVIDELRELIGRASVLIDLLEADLERRRT